MFSIERVDVGRIVYQKYITRHDLKANPWCYYVFGDNLERRGFGGQAREMRGEPNAVGIATKRRPGNDPEDFFADGNNDDYNAMADDIRNVFSLYYDMRVTIVLPLDGIGTGLSEMPKRCPKLYRALVESFSNIEGYTCPWPVFDTDA